jgi:hypothetical protein
LSRAVELVQAIVNELNAQAIAEQFAFDPVIIKKSYTNAYNLETLTDYPTVYVRCASKEAAQADRAKRYKQDFVITVEIVGALKNTDELNNEITMDELEKWVQFADEVERAMKQHCSVKVNCTLLNYTCDPLYEAETLESMNVFRAFQSYNYTITEKNTL